MLLDKAVTAEDIVDEMVYSAQEGAPFNHILAVFNKACKAKGYNQVDMENLWTNIMDRCNARLDDSDVPSSL